MPICLNNYKLVVSYPDLTQRVLSLKSLHNMQLPVNAQVTVVEVATGKVPKNLITKRQGNKLLLELEGEGDLSQIVDFYQGQAQFAHDVALTEAAKQAMVAEPQMAPACLTDAIEKSLGQNPVESTFANTTAWPAIIGGGLLGGIVIAATTRDEIIKDIESRKCTEVFTITQTTSEGVKQPFTMKVGDRFEVMRDADHAIVGYTFNGEPAPQELVQAFLGAQGVLPTEFEQIFQNVQWIWDDNGNFLYHGFWNEDYTASTPLDENLVPLYLNQYNYQRGFSDRLTNEYFGTDTNLGYYFDAIEIRENGTYLIGTPGRMTYLMLQSGTPQMQDQVSIRLHPDICGAFFVEADAAEVNFSASRSSPDAFTKLESVSVVTEQDSQLFFENNGGVNFANALKDIHVEVTNGLGGWARVDVSAKTNDDTDETVVRFMTALESITVIGSNANADLDITASGGDYFMSALKSIHVEADGKDNVAYLSIKASANSYNNADGTSSNFHNDYFMHNLESIKVISADALATFSVSASGGSHFMDSLKTITVEAGFESHVQISASVNYAGATGDHFMSALETISITNAGRVDFERYDRVSLSISNGSIGDKTSAGDMFMASLKSIRLEAGINNNALLELDNHAGNDFMNSLERVEVLASDNGYAVVELRNFVHGVDNFDADGNFLGTGSFVGEGFMSSLSTIEVAGLNAFVNLGGAVGKSEGTITMDLTRVGGAQRSLAVVTTQDADFGEGATTTLITKIGTSNLQVNAVYEANIDPLTTDPYYYDQDWNYLPNPYYIPESEREFLHEGLFTNTAENQVGDADARRTISMTEDPYSDTYYGGLRTIDGVSDFVGFAGLNLSSGSNETDYPAGWVDMGGNGIKDIFQFTSADMGNVVMGGFEKGQDVFDFSLLSSSFSGHVNDQSAATSAHVTTAAGGILATKVDGTDDIKIWLNTDGGDTAGFGDFESWIYVVNGSTMTWSASDFFFA